MKLLLDEMISPRVARELREHGYDVQAVKRGRPDLASRSDREIVRQMAVERRAIVTNDIADFHMIHDRFLATEEEHAGMVFTLDATMPRTKDAIPRWTQMLAKLIDDHPNDDSLRNRVHHLVL